MESRRKKRILIVDDETEFCFIMDARLSADGFDVFIARDGDEALDKVEWSHPDLIVMDVMLPRMSGYQLCEALHANPETKDIPIIVLTGRSLPKDKLEAQRYGIQGYFVKGPDLKPLIHSIESRLH